MIYGFVILVLLDGLVFLRGDRGGLLSVDPVRLRHHVKQGGPPAVAWSG